MKGLKKLTGPERLVLFLCFVAIIAYVVLILTTDTGFAEGTEPNAWILRRSVDQVLIRKNPADTDYVYSKLVDNDPPVCAELVLTGGKHGRWLECVCAYLPDRPTGWVREEFVSADKPEQSGRVATVIHPVKVGGYALVKGDRVKVLYRSESICTTIWGMVPTDALDFALTGEVTQPRRVWPDWIRKDHLINIVDWW